MFAFLRDKPPLPEVSPEDRLRKAIVEFNAAWAGYEASTDWRDRLRPWLDWGQRKLTLTRLSRQEVDLGDDA